MRHYEKHEIEFLRAERRFKWAHLKCLLHLKICKHCRAELRNLEDDSLFLEEVSRRLAGRDQTAKELAASSKPPAISNRPTRF